VAGGNLHLWWLVTRERPLTDQKILDLLEDCKSEMGIRTILGVVITDKVKSPALFGFVRPRLLLPTGITENLSLKELRHVFLHELAHLKRHDIYLGYLASLLQSLHWFNPVIWLAFYRIRTDRELACDALVLAQTHSSESKDYGRTIVSLLERFSHPRHLPAMAGILETKSQLKRRIKMIAKFKKTSRSRWAGAMLLLVVLACLVLTNAYIAKADFIFGPSTNLGSVVNSSDEDWGPSLSSDGLALYFHSARTGGYGGYDIWVTTRETNNSEWSAPRNLGPTVNSSSHEGNPYISADGLTLLIVSDRPGGYGSVDLWIATRETKENEWNPPVNLGPTVNGPSEEMYPCISSDGLELYFNLGVNDGIIMVTRRETVDDPWSTPVSPGPTINDGNASFQPNLSADGLMLLFGSWRPGGYGKQDIWITTRATKDDPWGEPVNLGPEVNSSEREVEPTLSYDGSILYFGSNRSGGVGSWDLWQAQILPVVDFNGDGNVDSVDVCMMLDYWHTDEPLYDIAPMPFGDGIVDTKDLVLLAEHLTLPTGDPNLP